MANKKELPRRRSLNDRLDAELASAESIPVAGITTDSLKAPSLGSDAVTQKTEGSAQEVAPENQAAATKGAAEFQTKKATTIMPKEVFLALQRYCAETDTPKHRALYLFIIEGLHGKGVITDIELQRYREMASQLTTTYEKK